MLLQFFLEKTTELTIAYTQKYLLRPCLVCENPSQEGLLNRINPLGRGVAPQGKLIFIPKAILPKRQYPNIQLCLSKDPKNSTNLSEISNFSQDMSKNHQKNQISHFSYLISNLLHFTLYTSWLQALDYQLACIKLKSSRGLI